jgi:DNA-directed RNA polymerase subunit omega
MIHPSYVELMKVINENVEEGEEPVVNSRYSVVCATAKRARQIIDGSEPLIRVKNKDKALSVAVEEMNAGELRILTDEEAEGNEALVEEGFAKYMAEKAEANKEEE